MTKEERIKEYNRVYYKGYYEANKERIKRRNKLFRDNNPEYYTNPKIIAQQKEYRQSQKFQDARRDVQRTYQKDRRTKDPAFKLICNIRTRQSAVLKGRASTTKGLGCDRNFLMQHIESQFTEGMNWNNYGHGEGRWTIDHKIPLDVIRTNPELTLQLIHYTNLQPMWYIDNVKKSKKII